MVGARRTIKGTICPVRCRGNFLARPASKQMEGGGEVPDDEAALVDRSRRGDTRAFDQLMEASQDRIYHLAYRITGNHADAQDAAQDAFVKAYRSLGAFRGHSTFSTWLHRIAVNAAMDIVRRRVPRIPDPLEVAAPGGDPLADGAEHIEIQQRIHRAIAALPVEQRMVVVLRDIQGWAYEEIAKIVQVPIGTVRSRLARGREALRLALADLAPVSTRL
jgi:RNA polymerase sigma-70 factor, ECF subfamily